MALSPQDAASALRQEHSYDDPVRGRQPGRGPINARAAQAITNGPPQQGDERDIMVIRHGATKLNNDDISVDRLRGWTDVPLSDDGKKEAEKLGQKLKADPPDVLVSSDLSRAAETADIISQAIGVKVSEKSQAFRPWDVGKYAGQTTKDAIPILADYAENKPDEPVPGGKDSPGESFNSFKDRLLSGLQAALDKYDGRLGIVTHHRDERLLHAWAADGFPADGSVDINTFNQKGEPTGAICPLSIPTTALKQAASEGEADPGSPPKPAGQSRKAPPQLIPAVPSSLTSSTS